MFNLEAVPRLGELLLLSEVDLSLFAAIGGMYGVWAVAFERKCRDLAQL